MVSAVGIDISATLVSGLWPLPLQFPSVTQRPAVGEADNDNDNG